MFKRREGCSAVETHLRTRPLSDGRTQNMVTVEGCYCSDAGLPSRKGIKYIKEYVSIQYMV